MAVNDTARVKIRHDTDEGAKKCDFLSPVQFLLEFAEPTCGASFEDNAR
jgi:hypothetical protein